MKNTHGTALIRQKPHQLSRGFTILELMVAMLITAILVGVAVPNLTEFVKNNRLTSRSNDLVIGLNIARQTAVSRNQAAFICHSNNANVAAPTCGGGDSSTWSSGYIVYLLPTNVLLITGRVINTGTDTIIQQIEMDDGNLTVTQTDASQFISFDADGTLFGSADPVLTVCDDRAGETGKQVSVTNSGRIVSSDFVCT